MSPDRDKRAATPDVPQSGLAAVAAGDTEKAKTTFETLKKTADAEAVAGSGFAQRAEQMLDRLGN